MATLQQKIKYEMPKSSVIWIREALAEKFTSKEADEKFAEIMKRYEEYAENSPDIGGRANPMAKNFYGSLSAFAYYDCMGRSMTPEEITAMCYGMMMAERSAGRPLDKLDLKNSLVRGLIHGILRIGGSILNRHKADGSWGNTWGVKVNPLNRKEGISVHLVGCPIADFANRNGFAELMPYFCRTDKHVMEALGGTLYREHTVAEGHPDCDYWIRNTV